PGRCPSSRARRDGGRGCCRRCRHRQRRCWPGWDGSHGRLLSEGFFALHCCLSSNWVRDAELCTMIVPLRDGRVKGSSQCSRQPSLAEMSAAADMSRSRAERALTSVKRKLGPEAEI